jgi:hypothetical protein
MDEIIKCSKCIYNIKGKCTKLKDYDGHVIYVSGSDYCSQGIREDDIE